LLQRNGIIGIFDRKFTRNTTADFEVDATYVTSSARSGVEQVEVTLLMDIPSLQAIRYTPSFLENFLLGWT
jgi:hypothetical protein